MDCRWDSSLPSCINACMMMITILFFFLSLFSEGVIRRQISIRTYNKLIALFISDCIMQHIIGEHHFVFSPH